ncbi:MAG: cobaltochelatase subunit CobN, partial [Minwuiales bacterium]|nr:cobaltochelatase subunit CobN [Minwuiales bacterium]
AAGQAAHAVGLDAPASLSAFLEDMSEAGYRLADRVPSSDDLARDLCRSAPVPIMDLETYGRLFGALPAGLRRKVLGAWGSVADDPAVRDGAFHLCVVELENVVAAIQSDRGNGLDRKASYHDPDLPPRHGYVAFYLWLRHVRDVHAIVHFGTHGTLEWLPGKAVAQSADCFPARLTGGLPVLYPFIVNNPGEAAAAKRRLGAVTIGHLTPPLKSAGSHGAAQDLEKLIDEYAAADGLDARRMTLLRDEILQRAAEQGLLAESGATEEMDEDERLARLDAYLCDVKELQIRDGLHVFGRAPAAERMALLEDALVRACPSLNPADLAARLSACAAAEQSALLAGLDGRFVEPGAAGAPTRGRADVLPTGRNLYTIDPRAVPTRSALALASKAADALIARHLQEHGDWPRAWLIDLWGSTTIRTGGEDFALALVLMGVAPVWDNGSNRVNGFEVLPLAVLDRPRADVTLRISGLFRDTFEPQITLFDAAVRAVAARDHEDDESNPLLAATRGLGGEALRRATARVYGAVPGDYGAGLNPILERGAWQEKGELGKAYLAASAASYGQGLEGRVDRDGFAARVKSAQAFVHHQDHREIDLLEDGEYANHEGGFAAAAEALGASPALYHADISDPDKPVARTVPEEIGRVVRGRVANPAWLEGMMRHGYRGGAEMARALDALFGFAATLPARLDRQFDLVFDATLGDTGVDAFLRRENPEARDAMRARFDEAMRRDLWRPRRNSVAVDLPGETEP